MTTTVAEAEVLTSAPRGADPVGEATRGDLHWYARMGPDVFYEVGQDWPSNPGDRANDTTQPQELEQKTGQVLTPAQVAQDALSKQLATDLAKAKREMEANSSKAEGNPDRYVMIGAWLLEREPHPFKTRRLRSRRTQ